MLYCQNNIIFADNSAHAKNNWWAICGRDGRVNLVGKIKKALPFVRSAYIFNDLLCIMTNLLEFSSLCSLFDAYCNCYCHTNHWVVTNT